MQLEGTGYYVVPPLMLAGLRKRVTLYTFACAPEASFMIRLPA